MSGEWTITGKKHQVDGVDKDLKKGAHIKGEKTPDGKLIVETKNEGENQKVINAVFKNGAKIKK